MSFFTRLLVSDVAKEYGVDVPEEACEPLDGASSNSAAEDTEEGQNLHGLVVNTPHHSPALKPTACEDDECFSLEILRGKEGPLGAALSLKPGLDCDTVPEAWFRLRHCP